MSSRPPVSVQLYTVREELAADLSGTLGRLAQVGFQQVEVFDFVSRAEALASGLAEHGLVARSAHASLIGEDLDAVATAAARLGVSTLLQPWVDPERWTERASVLAVAHDLNEASKRLADQGFVVGYHNHWFELELEIAGRPALEVFADALDDDLVLELDTYWVQTGGVDPAELLVRLGERVTHLHLKDGAATLETKDQVALGSGALDIPSILAAAPWAVRVLELDDFRGDVFDALRDGLAYLASVEQQDLTAERPSR